MIDNSTNDLSWRLKVRNSLVVSVAVAAVADAAAN